MYIDIREDIEEELNDRLENATKYNGDIFRLTEYKKEDSGSLSKYPEGNHGDIIKYINEEVKTLEDIKVVLKALIGGLNREV